MLTLKERYRLLPWGQSPWPGTKDDALNEKTAKYYPDPRIESCDRHGPNVIILFSDEGAPIYGNHVVRFTSTGIWGCCAIRDSVEAYNAALATGLPKSVGEANAAGLDFYWVPLPGKYCGHIGMKTLSGSCYQCETARQEARRTPRQQAITNGETWYQPESGELCKNGHNAPRRISNGSCRECEVRCKADNTSPIWRTSPDLIISREDAKTRGLMVYRTGQPCKRGHSSFRYISTGNCLECMGRISG